jgi:excinuclease ABC subunit C
MTLEQELQRLPDSPGVYLLYDATGHVIYVGKARSLSRRVPAHFRGLAEGNIVSPIGQAAADLEVIVTANEAEALVLEDNLVKRYSPAFNVKLKDAKTFPYVRVTLNEPFPRVEKTRRIEHDGSRYFGPYPSVKTLNELLKSINRVLPIATCRPAIVPGKRRRACLKYDIGRCPAPCVAKISQSDYAAFVDQFILMLTGRHDELEAQLTKNMQEAAQKQDYERAVVFRDRLQTVQRGRQAQRATIWNQLPGHRDILGLARSGGDALVQLLMVRAGRIVGQQPFPLTAPPALSDGEVMEAFLKQYYLRATDIPEEVVISVPVQDANFLEDWLAQRREDGQRVQVVYPETGPRFDLVQMANENAQFHLHQLVERLASDRQRRLRGFAELVKALGLPREPHRIEGFDVSTLLGGESVAVCVVFHDGLPEKSQYRRFKIRGVARQDDFAMMREVVERRYRRLIAEKISFPDLVLVDGGPGQLNMGYAALRAVGAEIMPIIGLAKGESSDQDVIYVRNQTKPIRLSRDSEGLRLLQRVRDEAHRFAITYHRGLREKQGLKLTLTDVPGIGVRRASRLLQHFGSLKAVAQASVDELAAVPTMTRQLAEAVLKALAKRSFNPD